jgi:protein-tyrosine-phosphatase
MASNLLAHHLGILRTAGVVARSRSEADQRRTYLQLVPTALTGLLPAVLLRAPRVVFVCTHNSARSQLAATLWSSRSPVPSASAGTQPSGRVHPRAAAVARRHGLSLAGARTAHVRDVVEPADLVVAVCDSAYEELGRAPGRLHWSVPDPVPAGSIEAFERAYADIEDRVNRLVPAVRQPD